MWAFLLNGLLPMQAKQTMNRIKFTESQQVKPYHERLHEKMQNYCLFWKGLARKADEREGPLLLMLLLRAGSTDL